MTKKRTPHSSKRATKKSKKSKRTTKSNKVNSMPLSTRYADGEIEMIRKAAAIMQHQFPDERHTLNSFIRMSAVGNAKRTLAFKKGQKVLPLFEEQK